MDLLSISEVWDKVTGPIGLIDGIMRILATATFFIWNTFEGSVFESPYTLAQVKLYEYPIWRLALVFLVFSAAIWWPQVGAMVAVAVFFYLEDLQKLTQSW